MEDSAARQRLWHALSLCKKAGALAVGFDAVAAAQDLPLLLFASDVSDKTRKRLLARAQAAPAYTLPYTQEELAIITRKPAGVLAVTNKDLAALCAKAIGQIPASVDKEEPV